MRIDISAVNRVAGTQLTISESGIIADLNDVFGVISVTQPVVFNGTLTNQAQLLRLDGEAQCTYETRCDFCAEPIQRVHRVGVHEDLFEEKPDGEKHDEDQFTYQGNWLELDKILSDNIAMTLPMHHRCKEQCQIMCSECGEPVTGSGCGCDKDQRIDPRLAALKDLVDKQQADKAD
ncbi:MAG: DUF177 domain-containing protein [Thermoclostridium sp.]|nr:DUF177 domain-containing protein [Thermoclostridium sp.]